VSLSSHDRIRINRESEHDELRFALWAAIVMKLPPTSKPNSGLTCPVPDTSTVLFCPVVLPRAVNRYVELRPILTPVSVPRDVSNFGMIWATSVNWLVGGSPVLRVRDGAETVKPLIAWIWRALEGAGGLRNDYQSACDDRSRDRFDQIAVQISFHPDLSSFVISAPSPRESDRRAHIFILIALRSVGNREPGGGIPSEASFFPKPPRSPPGIRRSRYRGHHRVRTTRA